MRLIEQSDDASIAPEASEALGSAGHVRRQDLGRHVAPELGVGGAVHLSHAARVERTDDLIGSRRVPADSGVRSP